MTDRQSLTRGGTPWEPVYLLSINMAECLGCGRCVKVCGRNVLKMIGLNEENEIAEEEGDIERYVMTVADGDDCIGCGACARVCAKGCQTHGKVPALETA
jgi:Nif-specific ferredoxin III